MIKKIISVGSSAAVIIPKKLLAELDLKVGDSIMMEINRTRTALFIRALAKK